METTQKLVEKALEEGRKIANELQSTKTISEIDQLSDKVEKYCNFVDENFGNIDDFAENKNEKYSDLTFYLHMAIEEKKDHIKYYVLHPDETSNGILDFLDYLESKTWLQE